MTPSWKVPRSTPRVDYDQVLNEEQRAVVLAGEGPHLVIAGPGSGKTRTITYRVVYLLEQGVPPEQILLVTFTNRAAREMLQRVEGILGSLEARALWGGTFHHIGNRILRRHASLLGYSPDYGILDREDQKDLLETCRTEAGLEPGERRIPSGAVLADLISYTRNTGMPLEEVITTRYPYFEEWTEAILKIARRYQEKKPQLQVMDYDDLLLQWKRLLEEFPSVVQRYQERFRFILVDEYQDTNRIQGEIVDLLAARHRNLLVVGDDGQSIYGFRGAHYANILDFPQRYPNATLHYLQTNYRSTPQIVALAQASISHNRHQYPKRLRSARGPGERPVRVILPSIRTQAAFVARRILELRDEGVSLQEMAVLYRAHYHSMELQMELTRRQIPYYVASGLRFFEQAHIKDVLAYLRVAANPRDGLALTRILKHLPRIGTARAARLTEAFQRSPDPWQDLREGKLDPLVPRGIESLWDGFRRLLLLLQDPEIQHHPAEMIRQVLLHGYEDWLRSRYPDAWERLQDLEQLARYANQYRSVHTFLAEVALSGGVEAEAFPPEEMDREVLLLSTLHQAKGLEWDTVFVIHLVEGRFPSDRALGSPEAEEEERRLFYVACTRARNRLYLCQPLAQEGYPTRIFRISRFLAELDADLLEVWEEDDPWAASS